MGVYFINRVQMLLDVGHPRGSELRAPHLCCRGSWRRCLPQHLGRWDSAFGEAKLRVEQVYIRGELRWEGKAESAQLEKEKEIICKNSSVVRNRAA